MWDNGVEDMDIDDGFMLDEQQGNDNHFGARIRNGISVRDFSIYQTKKHPTPSPEELKHLGNKLAALQEEARKSPLLNQSASQEVSRSQGSMHEEIC